MPWEGQYHLHGITAENAVWLSQENSKQTQIKGQCTKQLAWIPLKCQCQRQRITKKLSQIKKDRLMTKQGASDPGLALGMRGGGTIHERYWDNWWNWNKVCAWDNSIVLMLHFLILIIRLW